MNDADLLRYSRHILLDEIGVEGQERLRNAHALVIGAGGLGSPVALYLGGAGVGRITLVDDDLVDATNLQRQIAHSEARLGWPKVESAKEAIRSINPQIEVLALSMRVDGGTLDNLVHSCDVVLDCSDNFSTRHAVNAACVRNAKPLVAGAAIRFDGQIAVFNPRDAESPCYACVFPPDHPPEETRCAVLGVFAPLVGIIGSMQAAEALKLMAQVGRPLTGRLLLLDAKGMEWSQLRLPREPQCPVCARRDQIG